MKKSSIRYAAFAVFVLITVAYAGCARVASKGVQRVAPQVAERLASKGAQRVAPQVAERLASKGVQRVAPQVAERVASKGVQRVAPQVAKPVPDELLKLQKLGPRGEWVEFNRQIDRLNLPDVSPEVREALGKLQAEAKQLHGLDVLQAAALAESGSKALDVTEITDSLAALQEGTKDPTLVDRVRLDLVAKAEAAGHPDVARKLRDIKLPSTGPGGASPGPPPASGGPLPTPEAGPGTVRPPPKESVREGLPPLPQEKPSPPGASSKAGVQEQLSRYASDRRAAMAYHLHRLAELTGTYRDQDSDDGSYEAEVRRALGRELTASERVLVRAMRKQGKRPGEAAALLKGL
jgi:hypothetical protein